MTLPELLIALMSIFFIFDSATIHIINIPFVTLLIIYISSIVEIFIISIVHKKSREGGG
jgi:hypothetical protein